MIDAAIVTKPIEVDDVVVADESGARVEFCGLVRNHDEGRSVTYLIYEAHPDAERFLHQAISDAVLDMVARTEERDDIPAEPHSVGDVASSEQDVALPGEDASHHRGQSTDKTDTENSFTSSTDVSSQLASRQISRVFVRHRVGELHIGDQALQITVDAAHRQEAFLLCSLIVDHIKDTVPIWKRQFYLDNSQQWVGLDSEDVKNK